MDDETLGHHVKCKMTMILEGLSEDMSAQITARGTNRMRNLREIVTEIAERDEEEMTMIALLRANAFDVIFSDGVVQAISRK